MEYGNNYLTPSAKADDDAVSMLSAHAHPSRYSSYQQAHSRDSSEESLPSRTSLAISPLPSQQPSLRGIPLSPLLSPQQETPHGVEASLFESRAVLNRPYRETVAYENATTFGPAAEYGPKPDYEQFNMPGRDPPGYGSQRYFRPPRRVLEPWNPGWWARFPWLGMGALLIVVVCKSSITLS
ncbi:hypothetical protein K432DRAFT_132022 [Lepidopterella palustris CBS 459.81]|uniref:Uncharacterized protein n=1 Tax=Lepidopterella palustris CBS 459.81 TaxID=1314670 RepID=A0A8E2E453_9PEZI|nr:hypothetical protein K432DRAFT_132022 [Lepidopterella palustris CBS 459.81]